MGSGTKVRELVSAWQQAAAGQKPSPADLCAACPELLPELQKQIDALRVAGQPPAATAALGAEGKEPAKPRADPPRRGLIRIEGYHVVRELGRGGQAVVYEAVQKSTTRRVAVKVLLAGRFATAQERRRLEREAQVLAAVNHPNVVQVIDRGTTRDGFYYLVMEYVVGRSLHHWMERHHAPPPPPASGGDAAVPPSPRLDPAEPLLLFLKICRAVNAAHLRGIVHRDLKPGNIFIDEAGEPHVLDFGLARAGLTELADPGDGATPQPITVTGQFLGSLPWASPEQAEGLGSQIDARTDVYSLGVILYQLLTAGRFPYNVVGTMREVMENILKAQPIPPSRVLAPNPEAKRNKRRPGVRRLPQINPVLEAIALKALSKRREDRFQSAGELARDIEQYLAGKPTLAAPAGPARWRGRRRALPGAAAAIVFVLLAIAAGAWYGRRQNQSGPGAAVGTAAAPAAIAVPWAPAAYVPPAGRVVEILPLVAAQLGLEIRNGERVSTTADLLKIGLPYEPPAEYDFLIEFTYTGGTGYVGQFVPNPRGNGYVEWMLSSDSMPASGFAYVAGKHYASDDNPTRVRAEPLRVGRRYTSVVQVRQDGLRSYVNGRLVSHHRTDYTDISNPYYDQPVAGLRMQARCQAVYHRIAVIEVTGRGELAPVLGPPRTRPSVPYVQPAGRVVELLPLVRLPEDALRDSQSPVEWQMDGGELVAPPGNRGLVRLRYRPPAEYDYRIEFTRTGGNNGVKQTMPNPRNRSLTFSWSIGAWGNTRSGFDPVNGLSVGRRENPTVVMDGGLRDGARYTSVVQVRRDGVRAYVEGRLISEWKTDYADLLDPKTGPVPNQLEILTWDSGARFHRIAVTEVSGEGTLLPHDGATQPTTRPATTQAAGAGAVNKS